MSTTDRINLITGQVQYDTDNNAVLCVDSGPNYDPQLFQGQVQTAPRGTIAWVKTFPDGTQLPAGLASEVVSASFSGIGCFYIQDPGRCSGIQVDTDLQTWPPPGQMVSIAAGQVSTAYNQRVISVLAGDITFGDTGPLGPLGMNNRMVAGGAFNVLTPGVTDSTGRGALGLNNVGLLVKTWGRVTDVEADHLIVTDGSRGAGIWVDLTQGSGNPIVPGLQVGDIAAVTGVAWLESSGNALVGAVNRGTPRI